LLDDTTDFNFDIDHFLGLSELSVLQNTLPVTAVNVAKWVVIKKIRAGAINSFNDSEGDSDVVAGNQMPRAHLNQHLCLQKPAYVIYVACEGRPDQVLTQK